MARRGSGVTLQRWLLCSVALGVLLWFYLLSRMKSSIEDHDDAALTAGLPEFDSTARTTESRPASVERKAKVVASTAAPAAARKSDAPAAQAVEVIAAQEPAATTKPAAAEATTTSSAAAVALAVRPGDVVGLAGSTWLAMGVELEMQPRIGLDMRFKQAESLTRTALEAQVCSSCDLDRTVELQFLEAWEYERILQKAKEHWTLHQESDPGPLYELVSPWLRSEGEATYAVALTHQLNVDFAGGRYAALHLHVDGRCLLSDHPPADGGRRLAGLWLLWEAVHEPLARVLAKRPSAKTYGPSLAAKHPELLSAVQGFWKRDASDDASVAAFTKMLEELHDGMFKNAKAGILAGLPHRDGYRNFAVNLCHLLQIRCCKKCNKNEAPKHGLVEFRIFDVVYGRQLLLLMQLVERMVQRACGSTFTELEPFLQLSQPQEDANATRLMSSFLDMDAAEFQLFFPPEAPPRPSRKWSPM